MSAKQNLLLNSPPENPFHKVSALVAHFHRLQPSPIGCLAAVVYHCRAMFFRRGGRTSSETKIQSAAALELHNIYIHLQTVCLLDLHSCQRRDVTWRLSNKVSPPGTFNHNFCRSRSSNHGKINRRLKNEQQQKKMAQNIRINSKSLLFWFEINPLVWSPESLSFHMNVKLTIFIHFIYFYCSFFNLELDSELSVQTLWLTDQDEVQNLTGNPVQYWVDV